MPQLEFSPYSPYQQTIRSTPEATISWIGLPGRNENGERISLGEPILRGVTNPNSLMEHLIKNKGTGRFQIVSKNGGGSTEVELGKGKIIFRQDSLF